VDGQLVSDPLAIVRIQLLDEKLVPVFSFQPLEEIPMLHWVEGEPGEHPELPVWFALILNAIVQVTEKM
jgi:hypothetical protein